VKLQKGNLNYLPAELKEVSIELVKILSVLANHHILKKRLDKASSAIQKARMFLQLIPVHEGDLSRINAELQLSIISSLIYRENPKEQAVKLYQNVQEYQKPGVELYLSLIFHFILVVAYLKDGNSIQFYNKCKVLKGLLMSILDCKLTIPKENLRISQVISLKKINFEYLNKDVFCGIICFGVLLEWVGRRLSSNNDTKASILLANSRALAHDHSSALIDCVEQIVELIEGQIKKIEGNFDEGKVEGSKAGNRHYSINVFDYDKAKSSSLPTNRPSSGVRRNSFRLKENLNGSGTHRSKGSHLLVNAMLEEPTAAETQRSRFSVNKQSKQVTKKPMTARDQLQAALFDYEKPNDHKDDILKVSKIVKNDPLVEGYAQYTSRNKETSFSPQISSAVKHRRIVSNNMTYDSIGYMMPQKKKKGFKKETQEYLTFGAYYLGLHTLNKHMAEPLVLEKAQEKMEQELLITKRNDKEDNMNNLDISEIKPRDYSPLDKQKKFSLRKLMRSGTSHFNLASEKVEEQTVQNNLFSSFGIKKAEMLLLKRPSTSAVKTLNLKQKPKNQAVGFASTVIKAQDTNRSHENKDKTLTDKSITVMTNHIQKEFGKKLGIDLDAVEKSGKPKEVYKISREKSASQTHLNIPSGRASFREYVDNNRAKRMSVVGNLYKVPLAVKDEKKKQKNIFNMKQLGDKLVKNKKVEVHNDGTVTGRHSIKPLMTEEGREETSKIDQSSKNKSNSSKNKGKIVGKPYSGLGNSSHANPVSYMDLNVEGKPAQTSEHSSSKIDLNKRNSNAQVSIEKDKTEVPKLNLISIENSPANSSRQIGLDEKDHSISPKQKMSAVAISTNKLMAIYNNTNTRRSSFMAQPSRRDSIFQKQQILPTEEEHDSSDGEERTPKSNFFQGNRFQPRASLLIPIEGNVFSQKIPDMLEEIQEQEGMVTSPELSKLANVGKNLENDESSGFKLQELLRDEKDNFWEKAKYLRDNLQVKQDLLKFVKGFHMINDFYKNQKGSTIRMSFFVLRFFPDAVMIRKPKEGLEEYRSMLDYPEDFDMDQRTELIYKPW
jgi:hypothetical protein